MTDRPLVLVTGATGAQGGSVARHLLRTGRWAVRALTRDPRSEPAVALAALGADVVACDLTDPAQVRRSVTGIRAAFLVTDYWSLKEREYDVARRTAEAVLSAGAETLVHSSLPEAHRRSGGALALPHHDGKARLEEDLRGSGAPVVTVHLSTYYENWPARRLRMQEDGTFAFVLPHGDAPLPAVSVADLGPLVAAVLGTGTALHGEVVKVVGDLLPPAAYAAALTRSLGVPVSYQDVPYETYRQLPLPHARAIADMLEFTRRHPDVTPADVARARTLHPGLRTFGDWADSAQDQFAHLLR
ncbi:MULTISPECIES: NmrA/HSCARG family protein [unclassified Streptomyces]|uniref:NmrA/HSCARG family protein n=1 Tax=unclassified Streptomyces TaxID=2593676 RepID=UPI000CD4A774|nr:NmrA/HSCARG family protein [Streptomyces sp. SM10]